MGIENPFSNPSRNATPETIEIKSDEEIKFLGDKSAESLEEREQALRGEIAKEVEEFEENIENIESLVNDGNMTPSLKERLLSSIDTISNKIQSRFLKHLGGTAVLGGILGLQEYLINTEQTIVQDGSILGDANTVALAGVALYATIKSIQFAGHKIKEFSVKRGIEKGTVQGAANAAPYISRESKYAGVDEGNLDISLAEHLSLYDEHANIFREERAGLKNLYGEEADERWKNAMKRIRTESSKVLSR